MNHWHRIENLQYSLHLTLWVPGKDAHTPGGHPSPTEVYTASHPGMKGVHTASHYRTGRTTSVKMQLAVVILSLK